jgi:hypothetical protein
MGIETFGCKKATFPTEAIFHAGYNNCIRKQLDKR